MAKESVDFVFKADTADLDRAFKKICDEFDRLGKGSLIRLDNIDTQAITDAVRTAQGELEKLVAISEADAQKAVQQVVDAFSSLEFSIGNLDLSKPFNEMIPTIQEVSDLLKGIIEMTNDLGSVNLSVEMPSEELEGFLKTLPNISGEFAGISAAFKGFTEQLCSALSASAEVSDMASDFPVPSPEPPEPPAPPPVSLTVEESLCADIEEANRCILEATENIHAMDDAISCIDPVILNVDELNEELEEITRELEELRNFISQPIPLGLNGEELRNYQDAIVEASASVLELTQRKEDLNAQIEANIEAVDKFGEAQKRIDDASQSLREFGSLVGVDTSALEGSLGKLSQTIGYLPPLTTAVGLGFTGMATKAKAAVISMTKTMMANPILAILVAITAALVAGITLWSAWSKARMAANENSAKLANTLERQNKALREADLSALRTRFDTQRRHENELQSLRMKNIRDLNEAILAMNAAQTQLVQERHRLEMDALRSRHEFEQMMLDAAAKNTKQQTGIDAERARIEQRGEIEWRRDYETGRRQHFFKDTGEKVSDALGGDQDFGVYSSGASSAQQRKGREIGFRTAYVQQAADNIKRIQLKMLEDEQQVSDRKIAVWEREQQRFLDMNLIMSESENERVSKSIAGISELEGELERLRRIQAEAEFDPSKIRTWQGRHIAEVTDAEGQVKAVDLGKWSRDDTQAQADLKRIAEEINAEVAGRLEKAEAELENSRKLHDAELQRLAVATEYRKTIEAISASTKGIIDWATSSDNGVNSIALRRDLGLQRQLAENATQVSNFSGSDDERAKLHEENAWRMDMMKRQHAAAARHEQALFDTRLKRANELREFERETWAKNMESARQIAKLRIDNELELRALQRQSASKMLDMKLGLEIAQMDTYGKSTLQQEREQRDIRDRQGDEQARSDLKKAEKQAQLEADEEALRVRRAAEEQLQQRQMAERKQLEMELLNERAKMEEEWIKKEFQMRRELIAQEMEFKKLLERQMGEEDVTDHQRQRDEMNQRHVQQLQQFDTSQERAQFAAQQRHRMDALETQQGNESADLSHELDMKKARRDADIENTFQDKSDGLERSIRRRDAYNRVNDDREDRQIQRRVSEDNAIYSHRSEQRELDKTLRTGLMGSRSGTDRLRAMDDYRRDSHLLSQKADIEASTREEVERAKYRGADEQELNQIVKNSEEMIAHLQDQNDISKVMRDKFMDGSGGLRGLMQKESGQTEDMMSAWERIQQSAFNHITDPAADAVINMDRNEALRYAQQMNLYKEWFPKMARGNAGLAPD